MKHLRIRYPVLAAALLLGTVVCGPPHPDRNLLVNGNFTGKVDRPQGWAVMPGTRTECIGTRFPFRRDGLAIKPTSGAPGKGLAVVSQNLGATRLRGHRIRLSAEARLDPGSKEQFGTGRCFLRVDRSGGLEGFFDNLQGREIRDGHWRRIVIIGDVDADADNVAIGAAMNGPGRLVIRRFRLEDLGAATFEPREPPRPVDADGLANLEAFARTMGYIRYFHPSDEAVAADWNRLAVEGARKVEGAVSPAGLASALQAVFSLVAPTVRFLAPGEACAGRHPVPGTVEAVGWLHHGLGLEPQGEYWSQRIRQPLSGLPAEWSVRLDPLRLDLGRGVALSLPLVACAGPDGRTLPKVEARSADGLTAPTVFTGHPEDRATRLATVCLAWCGPQHFYPYFTGNGADWNAALTAALIRAATDPDGPAFLATLKRMNAALKDGHGRIQPSGLPEQVPAVSVTLIQGRPVVRATAVQPLDLVPGSEILQVDGDPVDRLMARLREEISAPDRVWMRARLGRDLLAGQPESQVIVRFRRPDGCVREAVLVRTCRPEEVRSLGLPAPVEELRPGIWYLDLARLDDAGFATWVDQHASCKGLVLDLRGRPGATSAFLGHFLERVTPGIPIEVPVVTRPDRQGWAWDTSGRAQLEPSSPYFPGKVACLADGGTASYSESCLALFRAYGLAKVVGERTAGVNGQLVAMSLPCGLTQTFTGMLVRNYDGARFHGVGLGPDLTAPATLRGFRLQRDEALDRALVWLSR